MAPYPRFQLELPAWIGEEAPPTTVIPSVEERMRFVLRLAARNAAEETGGPFGSAIFERDTGKLIAPGVNIVVPAYCSLAHAESLAIAIAEQVLGTHDLSAPGLPGMELVTSAQPCIQCFGNIWWASPARLVIGARREDISQITGGDAGPQLDDWENLLEQRRAPSRPIEVIRDVLRDEAVAILEGQAEIT